MRNGRSEEVTAKHVTKENLMMSATQTCTSVTGTSLLLLALITPSFAAEATGKAARVFGLSKPQFLKAAGVDSKYVIVMQIKASKTDSFKDPGMKIAAVIFTKDLAAPPDDLTYIERSFSFGTGGLRWRVRSAKSDVGGTAISITGAAAYENVGRRGIMKVSLSDIDKDQQLGIMIYSKAFLPLSNLVLFKAGNFKSGDGEAAFKAAVEKLRKTQEPDPAGSGRAKEAQK